MSAPIPDFGKYLIELQVNNAVYYCLWGCDKSEPHEPNRILCNPAGKVLAFTQVDGLIRYLKKGNHISFDESRVTQWAESDPKPESTAQYDLDLVRFYLATYRPTETSDEATLESYRELFAVLDLIEDYAQSSSNPELNTALAAISFQELRGHFMDLFAWDRPKEPTFMAVYSMINPQSLAKIISGFVNQLEVVQ